jgi:OmpA-OmpF porin, OOP family
VIQPDARQSLARLEGTAMKIPAIALASLLALCAFCPASEAADTAGPYVGLGVGIQFLGPLPFQGAGGFAASSTNLSFNDGAMVTGSVGYAFGNNLRTELELGYRNAPGEQAVIHSGTTSTAFTLDVRAYTFLANLLYDWDLARMSPSFANWSLHVGLGLGFADVNSNTSPSAVAFAYQPIVGVEYAFNPQLRFGVDYRYLGSDSANLTVTQPGGTIGHTSGSLLDDHAVLFTMRWNFLAP